MFWEMFISHKPYIKQSITNVFSLWCNKNQISKFNVSTRQNQRKWSAFTTGVANLRPSGRIRPADPLQIAGTLWPTWWY